MTIESPGAFWKDYELIDSGNFEKLERFGPFIMARPEPKALWNKSLSDGEWNRMIHTRFKTGAGFGKAGKEDSGTWERRKKMDDQWYIRYNGAQEGLNFSLRLGLTSFKHVGVFPEQSSNWEYIYRQTRALVEKAEAEGKPKPRVLNLFAYTGGATLAAKAAGADVTHLDSVRQVVTWARGNMEASRLDNIRWVVEDALKFARGKKVLRLRTGHHYHGDIGMSLADDLVEAVVGSLIMLVRGSVVIVIVDEHRKIEPRYILRHSVLALAVTREAEVDIVRIVLALDDRLIAHSGTGRASALGDR